MRLNFPSIALQRVYSLRQWAHAWETSSNKTVYGNPIPIAFDHRNSVLKNWGHRLNSSIERLLGPHPGRTVDTRGFCATEWLTFHLVSVPFEHDLILFVIREVFLTYLLLMSQTCDMYSLLVYVE